jgi:predicted amidophosphoribosyltransferase
MADIADEASASPDRAAGIILLNRWLKAIAALLGADAGCIVLNSGGISRIIARHNIPHAFMATESSGSAMPYPSDEELLVRDATGRPDLHAFLASIALDATGFFYRRTLSHDAARTISLVIYGQKPKPDLGDREIALAGEIAGEMIREVERYYPKGERGAAQSLSMSAADLGRWLERTDLPAAVFDAALRLISVNGHMRELLKLDWNALIGARIENLRLPAGESIAFLFRHALDVNLSTPRVDLALEDAEGQGLPRMLRVVGAPVASTDAGPLLIATIDPTVMDAPPKALVGIERHGQEATAEFLMETLVRRRALRSRKDVSYVTLRSWRQSIRSHQITALKAVKRHAPHSLAAEIAADMRDDINSLFGAKGFRAVVPMPCGHSAPGRCLSLAVAQALARDLELPVAHALSMAPAKGSSHPKTNVARPPMSLMSPVEGPVLLIDDVATSGRHVEEATRLLRGNGASVLAIAWIGGDAEEG